MIELGIAPIGWTNDDLPEIGGDITFEQCISEMALAGYKGCEVGTKFPKNNLPLLKKQLDLRNLRICNQWFSYEFSSQSFKTVKSNFKSHLNFLKYFGVKVVGGAETGNSIHGNIKIPVSSRKEASKEVWGKLLKGLNELGKYSLEEFGIKLSYHHHVGTMVENSSEVDRLLNETDDRYVSLNYDCGHFYLAGEDPFDALKNYMPRISHIHLKDVRNNIKTRFKKEKLSFLEGVKLGVFTVPGDGDIENMDEILSYIKNQDYNGWVVVEAEQDSAVANPFEYAKMGYEFINKHMNI
jgi:inosose dehydratase